MHSTAIVLELNELNIYTETELEFGIPSLGNDGLFLGIFTKTYRV